MLKPGTKASSSLANLADAQSRRPFACCESAKKNPERYSVLGSPSGLPYLARRLHDTNTALHLTRTQSMLPSNPKPYSVHFTNAKWWKRILRIKGPNASLL